MTSNNTIEGTQFHALPDVGDRPLVSDTSSDMFSRPIDVARHGLDLRRRAEEHGTAQASRSSSSATICVERSAKVKASLPTMLSYAVHAENGSLYNTPPAFSIYALGPRHEVAARSGRAAAIAARNERKAAKLYAEIDRTGFYRGTARKEDRSLMNVTFRLATEELEKLFVKESTAAGLDGLKGHRAVGGMRASIYNAFPEDGVDALVSFMQDVRTTAADNSDSGGLFSARFVAHQPGRRRHPHPDRRVRHDHLPSSLGDPSGAGRCTRPSPGCSGCRSG